jgi:hypothetical protein
MSQFNAPTRARFHEGPFDHSGPWREMTDDVATYVILCAEPLVALDLAQTVREFDAGARVLVASSVAEATRLVASEARITVALLGVDPQSIMPLGAEVGARGGRLVLFGPDAEQAALAWPAEVLGMPFTSERVIALLLRLSAD